MRPEAATIRSSLVRPHLVLCETLADYMSAILIHSLPAPSAALGFVIPVLGSACSQLVALTDFLEAPCQKWICEPGACR